MHNNYFFLKHLSIELDNLLVGAQLEVCFSQEKDELVLGFTKNQKENFLKATLRPDFSSVTVLEIFGRARRNSVNLWEEIYGLEVLKIEVFEHERAFYIQIQNDYKLVFKFFGNRPNLLVYKNENQIYLFNNALLTDKNLLLNDFGKKPDFSLDTFIQNNGNIRKTWFTLGKTATEIIENQLNNQNLEESWNKVNRIITKFESPEFHVGFLNEKPVLSLLDFPGKINTYDSAISAINDFYIFYQKEITFFSEKEKLRKQLEKEILKTKNYKENTENKLLALLDATSKEQIANILMANLHQINSGQESVTLDDFYNQQKINIKLKKELSPQKNAEHFYRKSKNEKIEIETIESNIRAAEKKIELFENKLITIERITSLKELKNFQKVEIRTETTKEQESPFRIFNFENWEIWVGKNAKNNDLLTQKHAQKEDYWLHARDTPGSHVVIKNPNKKAIPEFVAEYAASLAAFYSKRSNETVVPVIFTQKKYVRKGKGMPAGQVIVDKEKVLIVAPYSG
ncbi:MAG: NFACT RNA binding domain-containing protein [Spirosomataceae bacterium]